MSQVVRESTQRIPADLPVLALNAGSSSLKFGYYWVGESLASCVLEGEFEFGTDGAVRFHARKADGTTLDDTVAGSREPMDTLATIRNLLERASLPPPAAIGHRIVHGGARLVRHCRIDDGVLKDLEAANAFAPLHVPMALNLLRAAQSCFADAAHVACLDTAFHASLPEVASTLPIPLELRDQGMRRYGFHGLSCESIVRQLGSALPSRLVIAHLGSGASVTAALDGRSVDTSMGMTPSGGTIMGTRCGDMDPGVIAYLMREKGFNAAQVENLIDHRGGMLAVSGMASDMRLLRQASDQNHLARLAIEMFCRSVSKQIAGMMVALGGIDTLVFTGGIGANDADVRAAVSGMLSCLACDGSRTMTVQALQTAEEHEIALHAGRIFAESQAAKR